jgi:hypothetical protein
MARQLEMRRIGTLGKFKYFTGMGFGLGRGGSEQQREEAQPHHFCRTRLPIRVHFTSAVIHLTV